MSVGTYLVGLAIAVLIASFIGRPFRRVKVDEDSIIEKWVSNSRNEYSSASTTPGVENKEDEEIVSTKVRDTGVGVEPINFCPHCGRRVEVDHRFCPGCGKLLVKGAAE